MPADESPAINLFDSGGIEKTTKNVRDLATGIGDVESSLTSMINKAGPGLDKINRSLQAMVANVNKTGDVEPTKPGMAASATKGKAHTEHGTGPVAGANAAINNVGAAIQGMTTSLGSSIEKMTTKVVTALTNVFGGGANSAGPTSANGAILPAVPAPPGAASTSGSGTDGGGGGSGGGGSGGGSGISGPGIAADTAIAAGLYGAGQLANAGNAIAPAGMQWSQAAQNVAPFTGNGFGPGYATSGAMAASATSNQVVFGNNISGLGSAQATLIGIHGSTFGSAGYGMAQNQASNFAIITGQTGNMQAGAQGEAWLATAAGRNFLFTFGIDPDDPRNQNVMGVAESIAARLNGGTFPTQQQLQAMIGPGQPLTNSLYYLIGNMGMSNPDSTVQGLISMLMAEARSERNGTMLSVGSASTPAQAAATMAALGYNKMLAVGKAQATQKSALAKRSAAIAASAAQITSQKKVSQFQQDLNNWATDLFGKNGPEDLGKIGGYLGQIVGPLGGVVKLFVELAGIDLAKSALGKLLGLGGAVLKLPGKVLGIGKNKGTGATDDDTPTITKTGDDADETPSITKTADKTGTAPKTDEVGDTAVDVDRVAGTDLDLGGAGLLGVGLILQGLLGLAQNPHLTSSYLWNGISKKTSTAQLSQVATQYASFMDSWGPPEELPTLEDNFYLQAKKKGISYQQVLAALQGAHLNTSDFQRMYPPPPSSSQPNIAKGAVTVHVTVQGNVDSETSAAKLGEKIGETILASARIGKMVNN